MRDKLIRLLGGFTLWDMERVDVEANARLRAFDRELDYLQALVRDRNIEIQRLSDLIFARAGFIVVEGKLNADKEPPKPINGRPSWRQKQKDLEKEDAKRAADKTEAYWKEKGQEKANDAG
jgi:hypothetical protein